MPSPRIPGQIQLGPPGAARPGTRPAPPARDVPTVPAHALPHRSSTELLALARHGLAEAAETRPDGQRYATAHLAALRAAAALLVARARPTATRRGRPTNVWALLAMVAPEMAEWADRFAAGAAKRSAAEAGIMHVVSATEADTLCRDAQLFLTAVELSLGIPSQMVATPA